MKNTSIVAGALTLTWLAACIPASAADSTAGQTTFAATCAACHEINSFAGKSEAELEAAIQGIVAGTIKHKKKLTLRAPGIADIGAYISSSELK